MSACFQERLHSVEGIFRGCSESDPVSDQWLWQLQEPDFRAYQDFPGAQRAATKKGTSLTNALRESRVFIICYNLYNLFIFCCSKTSCYHYSGCPGNKSKTITLYSIICHVLFSSTFCSHFCALVYRAAYAGSGRVAGHGERPDQVQKEVPGDRADGPGCEGESRYGGKVCLLSTLWY